LVILDTNVLDWGQSNKILVALEKTAYIWNVESKVCRKVDAVKDNETSSYYVAAVCWDNEGHLVATGDSQGHLKVRRRLYNITTVTMLHAFYIIKTILAWLICSTVRVMVSRMFLALDEDFQLKFDFHV
jgi:hypothetical protein